MSVYEITRKINDTINDEVENRVRLYLEEAKGIDFAKILEETCKKNIELEEKVRRLEEEKEILIKNIGAIYVPPGTSIGYGHTGPCQDNCTCDVAKAKK